MRVYYHTDTYAPSKELKFRIRKLAEIAALAKLSNQTTLYNQAKEQHDSLVSQYNSVAETKKKGFWGQFLDNLTNTTTYVVMAVYLEKDPDYNSTYSFYTSIPLLNNQRIIVEALKKALDELERGSDLQCHFER